MNDREPRGVILETEVTVSRRNGTAATADTIDTDDVLARRIAAGDVDAWDRFFDRYSSWTYRFAYTHLNGNRADAEDLCSDIILTAAKSIGKFDPDRGGLDAWVGGIALHRLSRFCRRRRVELPLIPDIVDRSSDPEPASCNLADQVHVEDAVNRALASLPQRQAAALVAKYVEGYTTDELAEMIQASPAAAQSLLARARASFRSVFSTLMGDSPGGDSRG